jgi:hypothetical protein
MAIAFRHRLSRALLTLASLASFLGAGTADAQGVDPCPHHDALPLERGEPAHDGAGGGHAGGHGHGQDSGHEPATADHQNGGGHGHGPCTCVGSCDAGGSLPPLVGSASLGEAATASEPTPFASAHDLVPTKDEGWSPYLPHAPPFLA